MPWLFFIAINHQMRVITITEASQSAHEITHWAPLFGLLLRVMYKYMQYR